MADGQDKKEPKKKDGGDDEFPLRVTFKRTAKGEAPGLGEWPDVPAQKREVNGEVRWELAAVKMKAVPRGPQPGDTVVEKDGTTWLILKRQGGGAVWVLTCEKAKEQPKKP